jgi:hypothetical protein
VRQRPEDLVHGGFRHSLLCLSKQAYRLSGFPIVPVSLCPIQRIAEPVSKMATHEIVEWREVWNVLLLLSGSVDQLGEIL